MVRKIAVAVILILVCGIAWVIKTRLAFASIPQLQMKLYATYSFHTLSNPSGLLYDHGLACCPALYIADTNNHVIQQFSNGTLSVFAGEVGKPGYVNGALASSQFNHPTGISGSSHYINPGGQYTYTWIELWVNDASNYVVRRICSGNPYPGATDCYGNSNETATVAGNHTKGLVNGSSLSAEFAHTGGILTTASAGGPPMYVVDSQNHAIRYWDGSNVTSWAGTGTYGLTNGYRTTATFDCPTKATADNSGNIYVADMGNNVIRSIDTSGNVTVLAGSSTGTPGYVNGSGTSARFAGPSSILFNPADSYLYVADSMNNVIRRVSLSGAVTTYAGNTHGGLVNGSLGQAEFQCPMDLAIDNGFMYIVDTMNNVIRRIDMVNLVVSTYIS